ncbi:MAG: class II fructose-bisphosphate aldolase family protein [Clostridia bacterium]|nr:class II fructose-bisphosphate aldolase family protein [Clostridia bacterium]
MKQVKMLKDAMKNNYIVPAFNFANFEILRGVIDACIETTSPVILQVIESALNYFGDDLMFGIIQAVRKIKLPISIHLDHGKDMDIVKRVIAIGFDSVMIDGSTLPFKENVKLTKKVVTYAHKHNVSVEGEIGVLAVSNDDGMLSDGERFTNPKQAKDFVELTRVDSLAVSIGTNHGVNKYVGEPKIRYDILKKIEKEIPNVPIVLHGASLIEQEYVENINSHGGFIKKSAGNVNLLKNAYKTNIAKINMDTDFRLAYTSAVREFMDTHADKFCPRTYGTAGIEEVKKCATYRIKKICKSNDRIK